MTIDNKIDDRGMSAYSGKNAKVGGLFRFLQAVKDGRIPKGSILIVEDLDRISRQQPEKSIELFLGIINSGIRVVTLKDGFEYEQGKLDMSKLMMSVMRFCLSHEESEKKSYRLSQAWEAKRKRLGSEVISAKAPAWLSLQNGKFVVDKVKAATVKEMFEKAATGWGHGRICKWLNENQKAIGKTKHFVRSYVAKILVNRQVLGEYQPHRIIQNEGKRVRVPIGKPVSHYYPPIISTSLWYSAQKGKAERKGSGGNGKNNFVNLFEKLLWSCDGSRLQVVNKGYGRRLVSAAFLDGIKPNAGPVGFPLDVFERAILFHLSDSSWGTKRPDESLQEKIELADISIAELDDRIRQLQAELVEGGSVKALAEALRKLQTKRDEAEKQLSLMKGQAALDASRENLDLGEILAFGEDISGTDRRFRLQRLIRNTVSRIECGFIRDGRNYVCDCDIYGHNEGEKLRVMFAALFRSQMLRDKSGHPIKRSGATPKPQWDVRIFVPQDGSDDTP